MKRAGIVAIFFLLVAVTAASFFFFQLNQTNTQNLVKVEGRLKEVKKAFEERGRLLDGLVKNIDDSSKRAKLIGEGLQKTKENLKAYQAVKADMDKVITGRIAMEKSLKETQKELINSRKTAESSKVVARKELEGLKKKLADMNSLSNQLKQANTRIEKLNRDFRIAEAELESQKQLLKDKQVAIKEFEDLKISPTQIRSILMENTRLKDRVSINPGLKAVTPSSAAEKTPRQSLKTLPLSLELPLIDKRLTKPLKSRSAPKSDRP